ncbi:MAG: peptidase C15 [Leptolyngbyaceae cyanobacterium]
MRPKILLTSFATWKPEQPSNASDDLLAEILPLYQDREHLHWLRHLPVDFQKAPAKVIQATQTLRPNAIICCGMKEIGTHICVEKQAVQDGATLYTDVNLNWLIAGLAFTQVSHDAGEFVCNRLYFDLLTHLQQDSSRFPDQPQCPCIFVHIPVLTQFNRDQTVADFLTILSRIHGIASLHAAAAIPLSA